MAGLGREPAPGTRVVAFHDPDITGTVAYDGHGPYVIGDGPCRRQYGYTDGAFLAHTAGDTAGDTEA